MSNRISLHALAKEIEDECFKKSESGEVNLSYKTVVRRFKQFISNYDIDITLLKDENNVTYLNETESIFVRGILTESIDKNGFLYKLLYKDELTDSPAAIFEYLSSFMNNMYQYMTGKMSDTDRDSYMTDLDSNLSYSALSERYHMHSLIDTLYANTSPLLYWKQLHFLSEYRKKLEKDFAHSVVGITLQVTELAESMIDYKMVTEEKNIDYGDDFEDDTAEEYRERDRNVLIFLEQNPLIKEHIETKLNKTIEDIFQ